MAFQSFAPLTLFFSLPFYPAARRNNLVTGHCALAIEDTVYQLFDPRLLKADFLVSIMPVRAWLYEDGGFWVDRDTRSSTYGHVHLYKKAETHRTAVFYCGLRRVSSFFIREAASSFRKLNDEFRSGRAGFDFMRHNCASFIAGLFCRENWIPISPLNRLPAVLFKRTVTAWRAGNLGPECGLLPPCAQAEFRLHRFCVGLPGFSPRAHLTRWLGYGGRS